MTALFFFAGLLTGALVMDIYRDRAEIYEREQWLDVMERLKSEQGNDRRLDQGQEMPVSTSQGDAHSQPNRAV